MQSLPEAADHPLRGTPQRRWHPALYAAEFAGTLLLVAVGLSIVIALWAPNGPLANLPLGIPARRVVTGLLFGTTGALIALSPLGKLSGAHINPAMTLAFWLEGRIKACDALGYIVAQVLGGIAGATLLLAWGPVGADDSYGASLPNPHLPIWLPLGGEVICGFALVLLIFIMAAHKATRPFTPWINPPLFALLNLFESPASGASANPARSIGPALMAGTWHGQWIYIVGPCAGAALAVGLLNLHVLGRHHPEEARTAQFRLAIF